MFTEEFLAKAIEIACCTLSTATIHMKYICIIFFSQLYHENKSLDEAIKVLQTALSKHPDHANNQGKLFVFLFVTVTDLRTYYQYPSLQFTMHGKYSQFFFSFVCFSVMVVYKMYNSIQCWVPNTDHELHVLRF